MVLLKSGTEYHYSPLLINPVKNKKKQKQNEKNIKQGKNNKIYLGGPEYYQGKRVNNQFLIEGIKKEKYNLYPSYTGKVKSVTAVARTTVPISIPIDNYPYEFQFDTNFSMWDITAVINFWKNGTITGPSTAKKIEDAMPEIHLVDENDEMHIFYFDSRKGSIFQAELEESNGSSVVCRYKEKEKDNYIVVKIQGGVDVREIQFGNVLNTEEKAKPCLYARAISIVASRNLETAENKDKVFVIVMALYEGSL